MMQQKETFPLPMVKFRQCLVNKKNKSNNIYHECNKSIQLGVNACTLIFVACGHRQQPLPQVDAMEQMEQTEQFEGKDEENGFSQASIKEELLALEPQECYGPIVEEQVVTARQEKALGLANRVVTMYLSIDYSEADNVLMWAEAVELDDKKGKVMTTSQPISTPASSAS